ncbi:MAG: hypothetical protein HOP13_16150 [Alphaproteobacteria bacterium]|nr:hypothetical protein [Alphaproteobacteria bacterium]
MGRTALVGVLLAAGGALAAHAANVPHGAYVCTVEQTAGIGAEMMEGSDPPKAFIGKDALRFRIVVTPPAKGSVKRAKVRVEERPTKSAVLHGAYFGDGSKFTATQNQAFLRLDFIGEAGWLWFYHAGFEKPDVDHLNLTVRAGPCEPDK